MLHRRRLIHVLKRLAEMDGPFPAQSRHIVLAAERFGFSDDIIAFLEQLPSHEIFTSRADFIERCKRLEASNRRQQHVYDRMMRRLQNEM